MDTFFHSGSVTLIANVLRLCVCLPLAQCLNLTTNLMGQIAQKRCYKLAAVIYRKTQIKALNKKN
jgi:hypothetical protein